MGSISFTVHSDGKVTPHHKQTAKVGDNVVIHAGHNVPSTKTVYTMWNNENCCPQVFGVPHLTPGTFTIVAQGPVKQYEITSSDEARAKGADKVLTMNGDLYVGSHTGDPSDGDSHQPQ